MYVADTIAAVATPPGQGGVGIVRISGPLARHVARSAFARRTATERWVPRHLYHGRVIDAAGALVDEGLAVLMPQPQSFTGEDVLELHCHGSPAVLRRVLTCVLGAGARLAEPGEFAKRAFLNGRMDLAQAEAIIELVRARTDTGAALAAQQLSGKLSAHIMDLRAQLVRLKALLETQIDFPEDDADIDDVEPLTLVHQCTVFIEELISTYSHGTLLRDGARVAIVGKPNVGKSSLLNALLGEERAIVTAVPGTTRDSLDETVDFDGVPVVLSDTAGLRDLGEADAVEHLGMRRTVAKIADASLVLTVLDVSRPLDAQDRAVLAAVGDQPRVIVLNKIDVGEIACDTRSLADGHRVVRVSAKERLGLTELRHAVSRELTHGAAPRNNGPVLTNVRHYDAVRKAAASLEHARQSLQDAQPPDIVAVDVQDAIDHLGAITGVVTNEDVLDCIFSEFCIGK